MPVIWNKCQGEVWCKLDTVNLVHQHFNNMEGVYVIWHGGPNPATVYVGSGIIRERLTAHRADARIQAYAALVLFVTWAQVPSEQRNGVEAYLMRRLNPIVPERFPTAPSIEVNLPW